MIIPRNSDHDAHDEDRIAQMIITIGFRYALVYTVTANKLVSVNELKY